jgi:hypothetical protein
MGYGAWKDPAVYVLEENTVLLTADGRAEKNLADCAVVGEDRKVGPQPDTSTGWYRERAFIPVCCTSHVRASRFRNS